MNKFKRDAAVCREKSKEWKATGVFENCNLNLPKKCAFNA